MSNPGDGVTAPVGTRDGGECGGDSDPGAGVVIGGGAGVSVGIGVLESAVAVASITTATHPVELDFDAVVTVGMDNLALGADDNGGLLALYGGLGVQAFAVGVGA